MYSLILALATTETTTSAQAGGSLMTTFVTFGLLILIFYFLIVRPQKKRDKEARDMLAAMKKGDKVVTIGGIRGTVAVVKESTVIIKVDDNARIEFSKNAISQVLNKAEEKAAPAAKKEKKTEQIEKVEKPAEEPVAEEAPATEAEEK
ncbi:MAG: preprotein translocase subunit YajC [Sphaerochaetaceae bacterium]|nr:preprotein translocase subunit YajC [Sphaerochaetaceae bacterium]